jgi:hypothetical protein
MSVSNFCSPIPKKKWGFFLVSGRGNFPVLFIFAFVLLFLVCNVLKMMGFSVDDDDLKEDAGISLQD